MPSFAARSDRRRDRFDLLAAEMAAFAGVRIEPADGDARLRDAELIAERAIDDRRASRRTRLVGQRSGNVGEREMRRDERDAQRRIGIATHEHHDDARRVRARSEELGMAGERNARILDRALLHGRGDQRVERRRWRTRRWRRAACRGRCCAFVGSGRPGTAGDGQRAVPDFDHAGVGRMRGRRRTPRSVPAHRCVARAPRAFRGRRSRRGAPRTGRSHDARRASRKAPGRCRRARRS